MAIISGSEYGVILLSAMPTLYETLFSRADWEW